MAMRELALIAVISATWISLISAQDPVAILLQSTQGISTCYSIDGRGNNVRNPSWGAVTEPLLRVENDAYLNDSWWRTPDGPNPRTISNRLSQETCAEADRNPESCLNDWYWVWGQVIDHDMTMVPMFPKSAGPNASMDIITPADDPFMRGRTIPLRRSVVDSDDTRQQINLASSFLDGSQIYGTDPAVAMRVRTLTGGELRMSADGFPPVLSASLRLNHSTTPTFDELGMPHGKDQFLCADMRCNQHAPMAATQTMLIREHNRIARRIAAARHPAYQTDEQIFQAARALVIAEMQAVTYEEFLPLTLGRFNLPRFGSYNPALRPSVLNTFATAAFRLAHSMIGCNFREMTTGGQTLRSVDFASAFFDSTFIRGPPAQPNRGNRETNAYQTILHGLGANPSARMNPGVAPSLRSLIFSGRNTALGPVPEIAFDVIALDIQRGRDHGLIRYNDLRRAMGWTPLNTFADLTTDTGRQNTLAGLYASVNDMDLFVGLLAEDPLEGGLFGPVATSIMTDQFERVRTGDRCWYEAQFNPRLVQAIRAVKLRDLVDRNFRSDLEASNAGAATQIANANAQLVPSQSFFRPLSLESAASAVRELATMASDVLSADKPAAAAASPAGKASLAPGLRVARPGEDVVAFSCSRGGCEGLMLDPAVDPASRGLKTAGATDAAGNALAADGSYLSPHGASFQQSGAAQPANVPAASTYSYRAPAPAAAALGTATPQTMAAAQPWQQGVAPAQHGWSTLSFASSFGHPLTVMAVPAGPHSCVQVGSGPFFGFQCSGGGAMPGYAAYAQQQDGRAVQTSQFNIGNLFRPNQPGNAGNAAAAQRPPALSPAPGITQNINRAALPTVAPAVLQGNVFLLPNCRR